MLQTDVGEEEDTYKKGPFSARWRRKSLSSNINRVQGRLCQMQVNEGKATVGNSEARRIWAGEEKNAGRNQREEHSH